MSYFIGGVIANGYLAWSVKIGLWSVNFILMGGNLRVTVPVGWGAGGALAFCIFFRSGNQPHTRFTRR